MSFLNLMRNRLKPKEVNDVLMDVEGRVLPVTTLATAGQILKLTGENKVPSWATEYSYKPPAYSETEVNTGQKWIDGKDIYMKVFSNNFPEITTSTSVNIGELYADSLIEARFFAMPNVNQIYALTNVITYSINENMINIYNVATTYSEKPYYGYARYTKPTPDNETKKKTAKKSN